MALYIHILFLANWDDRKWQGKIIKRGSFITSLEHLSLESGLSIQETRTVLDKLIGTGEINKQSTNKYTLIIVNKYNDYQENQQTNNKPSTTTKEVKEVKNKDKKGFLFKSSKTYKKIGVIPKKKSDYKLVGNTMKEL